MDGTLRLGNYKKLSDVSNKALNQLWFSALFLEGKLLLTDDNVSHIIKEGGDDMVSFQLCIRRKLYAEADFL